MEGIRVSNTGRLVIQPFELQEVMSLEEADVIISRSEDLLDYLSIGIVALKRSISGKSGKIKIIKRDFSGIVIPKNEKRPSFYQMKSDLDYEIPMNALDIQRSSGNMKFLLDWIGDEVSEENETKSLLLYSIYVSHVMGIQKMKELNKFPALAGECPNEEFVVSHIRAQTESLKRFGDCTEPQKLALQLIQLTARWITIRNVF